jgi:ketosteroid isomerase-like protein
MSQEHVELTWRMVEWFNSRDAEAAQAHSTDDVEVVPMRAAIEDTTYKGRGAYAAFRADTDEAWERIQFDPESVREGNDRVVAIGRLATRGRGTGVDLDTRFALVLEFRGDKVSKLRAYTEIEEALEAAGLSE